MSYAVNYCNKYLASALSFSPEGREWIQSVLVCLQRALVPSLSSKPSCQRLKEIAFDSHPRCYTEPKSICDLPTDDWWRVFGVVWKGLLSVPGMKQVSYTPND